MTKVNNLLTGSTIGWKLKKRNTFLASCVSLFIGGSFWAMQVILNDFERFAKSPCKKK